MLLTVHWGRDSHPHLAQVPQGGYAMGSLQQPTQVDPINHSPSFSESWRFHCICYITTMPYQAGYETERWGWIAWPVPAFKSWVIKQRGDLTALDVVVSASLIPSGVVWLADKRND